MISSYDRPRSHSGLFYQRNLQSQCTIYLPVQLTPRYFGRQIHRKYPLVLWHMELPLHLCFPVAHSFTSAKQEVLLFGLPFFYIVVFAHERNTEKQSSLSKYLVRLRQIIDMHKGRVLDVTHYFNLGKKWVPSY